uniref:Uncharacterized protein AlNc14C45G3677 n=1 Tax=Albugo laibachii Nc14 TaxID=890382 RepID=F0WAF0_9STRA|nr:hypothetical protein ALNC14_042640 [Albugo laibachii Nc14]|eukprot:CCA18121.1 hypothetical protein ALNC14_042640 [Albugo laibachii Nc14]
MTTHCKLYTGEEREAAVTRIVAGEKIAAVSRDTKIPAITLKRYTKLHQAGHLSLEQRRGTKPTLPMQIENDQVSWIGGMQRSGEPVGREQIIQKANEIHHRLHGSTRSIKNLAAGWYRRFRKCHPELADRVAQKVSRARDSVSVADLQRLFPTLAKLVIEHKLQPSQIFNRDETSFESRSNTRIVVAIRGSPNVHTSIPETSFHHLFVASVAACGFAGAVITTAAKGFTNGNIFLKWIDHFASSVPASVPRPILLICDGCSSHIRLDSVKCSLDVTVFRPLKRGITSEITKIASRSSATTLSKESAVRIASKAFVEHATGKQGNIKNGFAATGLFPPSIDMMVRQLGKFTVIAKRGDRLGLQAWLQIREEVRTEVLLLPPKRQKTQRNRKTVDVGGRLLTKELLMQRGQRAGAEQDGESSGVEDAAVSVTVV